MDVSGSDILLFGGWSKTSGARFKHEPTEESCDYFMIWSTDTMSWKRGKYIGNPPTQRYGHTATVQFLIDKGSEMNVQDDNGWTPLHFGEY